MVQIFRLALKFTFVIMSFHVMIGALIVPSQNSEYPGEDGANYAFGFLVLIQVSVFRTWVTGCVNTLHDVSEFWSQS